MAEERFFVGVDVGTGSARAGVFDRAGHVRGVGTHPIRMWRPEEDFVEQSSDDIWAACGQAVRQAMDQAGLRRDQVVGVGFDATCSLVALDADDRPVSLSPTDRDEQNVVVWMDHRAVEQAERINETGHDVLKYVGGVISPEMQTPKLVWLKENLPGSWTRVARFLDLPDFLSYRATGIDTRSLCTTVCKWTYLGHETNGGEGDADDSVGRWEPTFFEAVGLGELVREDFARIGRRVRPLGERVGELAERPAAELGLAPGTAVSVSAIDAHAGGLGLLGAGSTHGGLTPADLDRRLALIGGTSSCHMAVSADPRFIPGIWGPYYAAMVPGMWLTEGGQSATGALIDHVIHAHARGPELRRDADHEGTTVYDLLHRRLDALSADAQFPAELTCELHVFPDFHGNRSPRADATLRGMISGLKLTDSVDSLALLYLATIQSIAHGTRHIIDRMNDAGYRIDTLVVTGGDTRNPVFLREHADVTDCRLVLPREREAVLLGAAMLGAVAAGEHASLLEAMAAMNEAEDVLTPAGGQVSAYHQRKHAVFHRMYEDQIAYRAIMGAGA